MTSFLSAKNQSGRSSVAASTGEDDIEVPILAGHHGGSEHSSGTTSLGISSATTDSLGDKVSIALEGPLYCLTVDSVPQLGLCTEDVQAQLLKSARQLFGT